MPEISDTAQAALFLGISVVVAIVWYLWLRRRNDEFMQEQDERINELQMEAEAEEAPYWESIARYEDQSLQALKAAERGEQVDTNLSRSIAYALQAQVTRNQLEDL